MVYPKVALFVCTTITCAPPCTTSRTRSSSTISKQITSPIGTPFKLRLPGLAPGTKSARTRSTLDEKKRKNGRHGMYSANGTGCRFVYVAPGPVTGLHTMPML